MFCLKVVDSVKGCRTAPVVSSDRLPTWTARVDGPREDSEVGSGDMATEGE